MILFTLYGDDGVDEAATKAGINVVLSKAAALSTLIEKARKLIRHSA